MGGRRGNAAAGDAPEAAVAPRADPLVLWGCVACKIREAPYRESFAREHEENHRKREIARQQERDLEAQRRQEEATATANGKRSWADVINRRSNKKN